jgi:hypothetical protein
VNDAAAFAKVGEFGSVLRAVVCSDATWPSVGVEFLCHNFYYGFGV